MITEKVRFFETGLPTLTISLPSSYALEFCERQNWMRSSTSQKSNTCAQSIVDVVDVVDVSSYSFSLNYQQFEGNRLQSSFSLLPEIRATRAVIWH